VGVQVDAGEVGRFAHEDDTEQEEGADGGGCADVGGAGRHGFDHLAFATVGQVAGDGLRPACRGDQPQAQAAADGQEGAAHRFSAVRGLPA